MTTFTFSAYFRIGHYQPPKKNECHICSARITLCIRTFHELSQRKRSTRLVQTVLVFPIVMHSASADDRGLQRWSAIHHTVTTIPNRIMRWDSSVLPITGDLDRIACGLTVSWKVLTLPCVSRDKWRLSPNTLIWVSTPYILQIFLFQRRKDLDSQREVPLSKTDNSASWCYFYF